MNKRNILIGIVVIAAIVLLCKLFSGCDNTPKNLPIQDNTIHAIIDNLNEEDSMPQKAEIYIDASASMKGYFISDNPDFVGQMSNLANDKMFNNRDVFFVGDPKPHTGMLTDLLSDLRKQPNRSISKFDVLLSDMCHKVENGKVVFLVTDGIMSIGETTSKALPELGSLVRKSLQDFDGAVAFFKFESEFKSNTQYKYYNKEDRPLNLNVIDRPYYVIAMGTKENIRALRHKKWGAKDEIYFGIHNHIGHTTNTQAENPDSKLEVLNDPVVLNATLPKCLAGLDKEYFEQNTEIYLNGVRVPSSAYGDRVIDETGDINVVISQDVQKGGQPLIANPLTGYVEFTLKVRNEIPDSWKALNSDDDSNIAVDSLEQRKTYGLLTLLNGIKEAFDDDDYLMELQFKFKQ